MSLVTARRRVDASRPPEPARNSDWIAAVAGAPSFAAAASQMVNAVCAATGARMCLLGVADSPGTFRLAAVSQVAGIDDRAALSRRLQGCLQTATSHPPLPPARQFTKLDIERPEFAALRESCEAASWWAMRWTDNGLDGVLLAAHAGSSAPAPPPHWSAAAATLALIHRAHRSRRERLRDYALSLWNSRRRNLIAGATIAALAVLAYPAPYRIGCPCVVEPALKRYLAAPFDGVLERSAARAGDVVNEGDLLALLDGRELRLERAAAESRLAQAQNRHETALAKRNALDAQTAELEVEQLTAELDVLTKRQAALEIRSPLAGVVVSGDLQRAEGAPVTQGQTLFEIAPRGRMLAELEIDEAEVAYTQPGQMVELRLDALPGRSWSAAIERITPRSELRKDRNVFIAELPLPNDVDGLRPGMNGRAVVVSGRRTVLWNVFHHAWDHFLGMLGW